MILKDVFLVIATSTLGIVVFTGVLVLFAKLRNNEAKVKIFWAWFDFWRGLYFDRKKRILYVCPLPTFVIAISFEGVEIPTAEYGGASSG